MDSTASADRWPVVMYNNVVDYYDDDYYGDYDDYDDDDDGDDGYDGDDYYDDDDYDRGGNNNSEISPNPIQRLTSVCPPVLFLPQDG